MSRTTSLDEHYAELRRACLDLIAEADNTAPAQIAFVRSEKVTALRDALAATAPLVPVVNGEGVE